MFHVLRSSYVVVMTARDEAASFKIFATLNGRGVDLGVVDKLKVCVGRWGGGRALPGGGRGWTARELAAARPACAPPRGPAAQPSSQP
jgi:hypothetical protein